MPKYNNECQKIIAFVNSKNEVCIDTQYEEPKKTGSRVKKEIVSFLFVVVMVALFTVTFLNGLADSIDKDAKRFTHLNQKTNEVIK